MGKGGIETWLMNVFRELRRTEKYPISFDFYVETHEEQPYDQEIYSLGGRIFRCDRPFRDAKHFVGSLANLLRKEKFYGVHAHGRHFMAGPVSVARLMRTPIRISHVHNLNEPEYTGFKHVYKEVMKRLLVQNSTYVLGCSQNACESLLGEDCTKQPKISFLPYGIDLNRFSPGLETDDLRKELGLTQKNKILGHVGRFVSVKRHHFLLETFVELKRDNPEWVLCLVGHGPEKENIERLAKSLGVDESVHFLGLRSDIPELCTLFDVFALPSKTEGLGLVLIEAQAVGTPCVITETLPQEVNAVPGLVFRTPHTTNSWTSSILEAASSTVTPELAHQTLMKSQFHIKNSVERLALEIYKL